MTKTSISFQTFHARLQRFHYTRSGAKLVISRAKWCWKPGEEETALDLLDPSMLDRFEESVADLVKRSVIYARALEDKFGDSDATIRERTAFKVAVHHFQNCMDDLGDGDRERMRERYDTMAIWMAENGIKEQ